MKHSIIFILCILLISCSSTKERPSTFTFNENLSSELTEEERSLWFGYSMGLGMCIKNRNATYKKFPLDCEVTARIIMAQMYENEEDKSGFSLYIQELYRVYKANLMAAYLWTYYPQPGWRTPSNIEKFKKWEKQHLTSHTPQTKLIGVFN